MTYHNAHTNEVSRRCEALNETSTFQQALICYIFRIVLWLEKIQNEKKNYTSAGEQ